jgi:hypothetical protein
LEQAEQNLTGFFVWQGEDVVADAAGRDIYISELSGLDRCIVTFDAKTARLEATG